MKKTSARILAVYATISFVMEWLILTASAAQPNIVFFLVDDLGWRDLGCYGSSVYETPATDRLAREGVRFTHAYAAYPRCVPSRYAIMTGRHPARDGLPEAGERLPSERRTVAEALKDGNYATFYAGKWHLAHSTAELPGQQGFQTTIGAGRAGATGSHFAPYDNPRAKGHSAEAPLDGLADTPEGEYLTDRLTDETIEFMRRQIGDHPDQPFFAVLAHYAVHTPIEAKPDITGKYRAKIAAMSFDGPSYLERDGTTKMHQDNATYAAMIESVDESLGRIMDALDELGIADNTLVVFTSDHGGLSNRGIDNNRELATSNDPLRAGKGHCYEGGVRVPLIVKWPGVTAPGTESSVQTTGTDHFPTMLDIAGLPGEPESHMDGISYAPALRGESTPRSAPIFWHSPKPRPKNTGDIACTAVLDGPYKLLDFYREGRVELYNLDHDIGEQHDLSTSEPDTLKRLKQILDDWRSSEPR